jgi:integrase
MAKRHPGNLERRGDSYRVRLCVGGVRQYVTIPTIDRRLAERVAREKVRELERDHERRAAGLPGSIGFGELLALFREQELPTLATGTQEAYEDSLKPIATYFVDQLGDPAVGTLQAKHITGYLTWRRAHRLRGTDPVSNRTLQKDRAVLHRLFALADRLEYRDGNPVARTRPPKSDARTPVILDPDQYEALLAACADRPMLTLYVLVLGEAGLRCESEALRLRWEDVDLEGGFLHVVSGRGGHRTKSGKGRAVPMTPRLRQAMRAHFAAYRLAGYPSARSPWVFHHVATRSRHRAGERIGSLRAGFAAAATRAKLPEELHQHDLRHRRVTSWLAAGANPVHVKEALGHSDLRTTMQYTHLLKEHLLGLVANGDAAKSSDAAQRT